jgi:hypothetical protein
MMAVLSRIMPLEGRTGGAAGGGRFDCSFVMGAVQPAGMDNIIKRARPTRDEAILKLLLLTIPLYYAGLTIFQNSNIQTLMIYASPLPLSTGEGVFI